MMALAAGSGRHRSGNWGAGALGAGAPGVLNGWRQIVIMRHTALDTWLYPRWLASGGSRRMLVAD